MQLEALALAAPNVRRSRRRHEVVKVVVVPGKLVNVVVRCSHAPANDRVAAP